MHGTIGTSGGVQVYRVINFCWSIGSNRPVGTVEAKPSAAAATIENASEQCKMDLERKTQRAYDRIAREYSRATSDSSLRAVVVQSLNRFAQLLPRRSTVLVLGSGDGRDARWLQSRRLKPVLVDYSQHMNLIARRRNSDALIITADARHLPFSEQSFDAVWSSFALYHLRPSALRDVLRDLHGIVRPGGIVYFNLRQGVGSRMRPKPASFPFGGPRLYSLYRLPQILPLLGTFRVMRVETANRISGKFLLQIWMRRLPGA
jgi:ubiquinone/menaquinone biosynthesis C-methylase UbiE